MLQDRRAARARRAVRHPVQSDLRSGGAQARAERHRAGDRRGRGHARRPRVRPPAGDRVSRTSRSAARSSARRRPCARSRTSNLRAYLARNYRAPDMVVAAAGAVDHARVVAEVEQRFASFDGPAAPVPQPAQLRRRHPDRGARSRAGACRAGAAGRAAARSRSFSLQVFTSVLGGGMSSRLFQEVREKRGLCYSIYASTRPIPTPACSASMPAPMRPTCRN